MLNGFFYTHTQRDQNKLAREAILLKLNRITMDNKVVPQSTQNSKSLIKLKKINPIDPHSEWSKGNIVLINFQYIHSKLGTK